MSSDHSGLDILLELGLISKTDLVDAEAKVNVLVRRQVSAKGKTLAWINDVPVTITTLKKLVAT